MLIDEYTGLVFDINKWLISFITPQIKYPVHEIDVEYEGM